MYAELFIIKKQSVSVDLYVKKSIIKSFEDNSLMCCYKFSQCGWIASPSMLCASLQCPLFLCTCSLIPSLLSDSLMETASLFCHATVGFISDLLCWDGWIVGEIVRKLYLYASDSAVWVHLVRYIIKKDWATESWDVNVNPGWRTR